MFSLAIPLLKLAVTGGLLPMVKLTKPEGVPDPVILELTVAVRATVWPNTEGLGLEIKLVVVPANAPGLPGCAVGQWLHVVDIRGI